jgi:hypothetical protein
MFSWYKSASECYVYLEDVQLKWDAGMFLDKALIEAKRRDWQLTEVPRQNTSRTKTRV